MRNTIYIFSIMSDINISVSDGSSKATKAWTDIREEARTYVFDKGYINGISISEQGIETV